MNFCFFFHINGHIHSFLVYKTLPTPVTISPASDHTIYQGTVTTGRIAGIISGIRSVSHFLTYCQMLYGLIRSRTISYLIFQIERMVSFSFQCLYLFQCASMKIIIVLHRRITPSNFRQRKNTRINHHFRMFRSRNIFCE